jgi:hypothetical protein
MSFSKHHHFLKYQWKALNFIQNADFSAFLPRLKTKWKVKNPPCELLHRMKKSTPNFLGLFLFYCHTGLYWEWEAMSLSLKIRTLPGMNVWNDSGFRVLRASQSWWHLLPILDWWLQCERLLEFLRICIMW